MNAAWWWSWLLAVVGVAGLWLAGSHRTLGWRIGVAVQVLWVGYAITTRQWGFIASALAYGAVNGRNLARWTREQASSGPGVSKVEPGFAQPSHHRRPDEGSHA